MTNTPGRQGSRGWRQPLTALPAHVAWGRSEYPLERNCEREKNLQLLLAPALRIGMPSPFPTSWSPVRHPKRAPRSAAAADRNPEQDGGSKLNLGLSPLHVCKGQADKKLVMWFLASAHFVDMKQMKVWFVNAVEIKQWQLKHWKTHPWSGYIPAATTDCQWW